MIKHVSAGACPRLRHIAFTLIELLMVITIIGILTGISVTVTRQVYHTARVAKTEATIQKLDRVLLDMYADYENRRVPSPNFSGPPEAATVTQAARLWFLRDMIRMEMPCNRAEIEAGPVNFSFIYLGRTGTSQQTAGSVPDSPLRKLYLTEISKSNGNYEPAKCLYLVVMYGNPEVRELFVDNEIATDDDGLSYFVDGWGNPIYFLRWAPGLALSERQSNNHPDPLDPTEVGGTVVSDEQQLIDGQWVIDLITPRHGWALLPVVMSSGGEREESFDNSFGMKLTTTTHDIFDCHTENCNKNVVVPTVDPFCSVIGTYTGQPNHAVIHNHSARR